MKKNTMDKAAALNSILYDDRNRRLSQASANRTLRALRALDLNRGEAIRVLYNLEYCNDVGVPYLARGIVLDLQKFPVE